MQKEAYKITGFTAVISALGFLMRWLQGMQIIDTETGLATPGKAISWFVVILILAVGCILLWYSLRLRRYKVATAQEKLLGDGSVLYSVFSLVPAVVLAVGGIAQILQPENQVVFRRICGLLEIAGAIGVVLINKNIGKHGKDQQRRIGIVLLILFCAFWLISVYKSTATDPVIWRFAIEILAICASLLALYYVAGHFFGEPTPFAAIFLCFFAAFLCVMSIIDEHTLADSLTYGGIALLFFIWGYGLTIALQPVREDL